MHDLIVVAGPGFWANGLYNVESGLVLYAIEAGNGRWLQHRPTGSIEFKLRSATTHRLKVDAGATETKSFERGAHV